MNRPPRTPFLATFYTVLVLGSLLPLLVLLRLGSGPDPMGVTLSWLVSAYAALQLGLLGARGEKRVLALTFWLFVYVWLGIAPLAQFASGQMLLPGNYTSRTVVHAFVVIGLGLIAYEVGYRRLDLRPRSVPWLEPLLRGRTPAVGRTLLVAALSLGAATWVVIRLGGVSSLIASRNEVAATIQELAGGDYKDRSLLLMNLLRVPPFVALYLLWWIWLRRRARLSPYSRMAAGLLIGFGLLVNALVSNPLNSARYWLGTILLSLAFVTLPWSRRWAFAAWTGVIVTALLVVFPSADLFRTTVDLRAPEYRGFEHLVEKDYDGCQQILNSVVFADERGHRWGRQLAGTLLFWVPRKVWPGKPVHSGELVGEAMGYRYTNISMPLWGEAYLDGGIPVVLLVFLVYGAVAATLESGYLRNAVSDDLFGLLVPILAAYQIFLLRGALMSAFAYLVPVLGLIAACTRPVPETDLR